MNDPSRLWLLVAFALYLTGCESCESRPEGRNIDPAPAVATRIVTEPRPNLKGPIPKENASKALDGLLGEWKGAEARSSRQQPIALSDAVTKLTTMTIDRRAIRLRLDKPEGPATEIRPHLFKKKKGDRYRLHVWVGTQGVVWVIEVEPDGEKLEIFELGSGMSYIYRRVGGGSALDAATPDGAPPKEADAGPSASGDAAAE